MTHMTRGDRGEAREELRRDRRREYLLLLQAAIAIVIVGAIIWVRQAFFV
jgi:hypothetical protein